MIEISLVRISIPTTRTACPEIHTKKGHSESKPSNSSSEWAGSFIAPNAAMSDAPMQTKVVPTSESRVKGSAKIRVAQIELKTKPD